MLPTPSKQEVDNSPQDAICASEETLMNATEQTDAIAKQIQAVANNLDAYKEQQNRILK
jgi:hypothetical protein